MLQKTKGFFSEFHSFAVKGNVIELAVAVLVGTAFGGVVTSLTTDILGPFLALLTNSVDLKTLSFAVRPDLIIKYGAFLQAIFNFLVITLCIFIILKFARLFKRG